MTLKNRVDQLRQRAEAQDTAVYAQAGRDVNGRYALAVFVITASTQAGAGKKWTYTAKKMKKTNVGYGGWVEAGAKNYTLYNTIEDQNAATGTYGNGVSSANLTGTFTVKPIPTGTRVFAQSISVDGHPSEWWIINYVNGIDGGCPT